MDTPPTPIFSPFEAQHALALWMEKHLPLEVQKPFGGIGLRAGFLVNKEGTTPEQISDALSVDTARILNQCIAITRAIKVCSRGETAPVRPRDATPEDMDVAIGYVETLQQWMAHLNKDQLVGANQTCPLEMLQKNFRELDIL